MTEVPPSNREGHPQPNSANINVEELIKLLRRKESNWVEWGVACQQLQKAGYTTQNIFEETGFEPIQQNQVIVASQVHKSLMDTGVSEAVRSRFERTGSDTLYELRILTQSERATAAEFIAARNIDSEGAREVAKALKEFSRLRKLPTGFANHPGDAVAYQYWKLARQQSDLQERSRLIARGLMFAHSQEARQQIEQLLTEAFGGGQPKAPRLPIYRLEADDVAPCLLPVAGTLPLATTDWKEVSPLDPKGSFDLVQVNSKQTIVAVPGWQVLRNAQEPIGIVCSSNQLPTQADGKTGDFLLIIDRTQQKWDEESYFIVDSSGELEIKWFTSPPDITLLGRLILVLRPKKIIDEAASGNFWLIEE
ncbi:MAG: RuBisCO accumulation factor 1 [Coleofasciculaceae cyanobacterium]